MSVDGGSWEEQPPLPKKPDDQRRPPTSHRSSWLGRTSKVLLFVTIAVFVLSFAVDRVGVDLEEAQSETRQAQLRNIIRVLARPELTTTDIGDTIIAADVAVPCGPEAAGTGTEDAGSITVEPACAEPGSTVTVSGTAFAPGGRGDIEFVPESEFTVVRKLGEFTVESDGTFSVEVDLPGRPADVAQQLQAVIEAPLGTWGDREEVWNDTNENGVRDEGIVGEDGLEVTIEELPVANVAIGLIDNANQLTTFVATEPDYTATTGPATGQAAVHVAEVEADGTEPEIVDISTEAATLTFRVDGPVGSDVSSWRATIYDIDGDRLLDTVPLGDEINLSPRVSETTLVTVDKIIDTVLLALVATMAGLALAIPLSFVAARNLMRDIQVPVFNLGLGLLALPVGAGLGAVVIAQVRAMLASVPSGGLLSLVGAVVLAGLAVVAARALFLDLPERSWGKLGGVLVVGLLGLGMLDRVVHVLTALHDTLRPALGRWGFVAGLLDTFGQILDILLAPLAMILVAGVVLAATSRIGYRLRDQLSTAMRKVAATVLVAVGFALWAVGIMFVIDWLYDIDDTTVTVVIPAAVGALLGTVQAVRALRTGEIRIGMVIYYTARTVFNALRSIEPLVMVIVFVIWVGFGEFAGSLALAIHTAAALAKLYSEQVESISQGPLEAVKAGGATRLQQVVYAVVPQVVPPYISFTMYRWDINVRMSTILGFAGGGGIGSILQQNLTLGNYRAASVQMLAITIVVATMDWLSARFRERLI